MNDRQRMRGSPAPRLLTDPAFIDFVASVVVCLVVVVGLSFLVEQLP